MTTQNAIKYLSGYFDGDGCFRMSLYTQKTKFVVYERSITITSTKKESIYFFRKNFGGTIGIKQATGNRKKAYVWTAKNKLAANISVTIHPHLINKERECFYFIEYCNNIKQNCFKFVPYQVIKKRNDLIFDMRKEIHQTGLVDKDLIINLKKFKNSIPPGEDDYIYLAGLIDAEGCLRISKRNRYRSGFPEIIYNTVLEIGNTKYKMIEWLIKRFGGSCTYICSRQENRRNSATWSIQASALKKILLKVHPFIIIKKEVCRQIMKFQDTILPNGGDRHSEAFKKDIKRRFSIREEIINVVHKLNHKGNT